MPVRNMVKASDEVINVNVKNNAKEDLGEIHELMIDKLSGKVVYAVLESGGFLGLNGKLFAIPWNSFHYDNNEDCFIININKEKIKNAPGFDKDHWPDMADSQFGESIDKYYGSTPY